MRDPATPFRPFLAAVLLAALSNPARAEDGWSPMVGHSLGGVACAAIDDPDDGAMAFAEGGEDGATPGGPASLAARCAADAQAAALPEGWAAWPGWSPFGAGPAAADPPPAPAAGLQSRTGGSTADPSGNAFVAPGLAPVWALWPGAAPRTAATSRSAPRDDALASPANGDDQGAAEDDGTTILLVDGTSAVQAPPRPGPQTGAAATIAEPATLAILGAAMAAAGLFGRRTPRPG